MQSLLSSKNYKRKNFRACSTPKRSNLYKMKIKNAGITLENSMHFKATLDKLVLYVIAYKFATKKYEWLCFKMC